MSGDGAIRITFRMQSTYTNTFSLADLASWGAPVDGSEDDLWDWMEANGDIVSENCRETDCDFGSIIVVDTVVS